MKKTLLFAAVILINSYSMAQKKQNWKNTFVYTFKLPETIPAANTVATVLYNGKVIIPKPRLIGGKKKIINSAFSYLESATAKIGNIQLPISITGHTFAWLMDADMLVEMTTHPERYKIQINASNYANSANYDLPAIFDFITEHTLNIAYLLSLQKTERQKIISENSWQLSLQKKEALQENIIDTTLRFSLKALPKGIMLSLPEINLQSDTIQHFVIAKAYLYNNRLLMPVPISIVRANIHDQCYGIMTDITGSTCATSGCIAGRGSGECAALTTAKNKIPYQVFVVISP